MNGRVEKKSVWSAKDRRWMMLRRLRGAGHGRLVPILARSPWLFPRFLSSELPPAAVTAMALIRASCTQAESLDLCDNHEHSVMPAGWRWATVNLISRGGTWLPFEPVKCRDGGEVISCNSEGQIDLSAGMVSAICP